MGSQMYRWGVPHVAYMYFFSSSAVEIVGLAKKSVKCRKQWRIFRALDRGLSFFVAFNGELGLKRTSGKPGKISTEAKITRCTRLWKFSNLTLKSSRYHDTIVNQKIRGQSFSRKIRLLIPSSMTSAGENSTPTLLPNRLRTNWDLSSNRTCLIHLQSYQMSCHLNNPKIGRRVMYCIGTKVSWIFVTELVKFELRVPSPLPSRWIVRRSSSCKTESYHKRCF
jgi:hypothetical protein